jgi:hypothetical protein
MKQVDTSALANFVALSSDDPVKRDLELRCNECDELICDIEDGDVLETLVLLVSDHVCEGE